MPLLQRSSVRCASIAVLLTLLFFPVPIPLRVLVLAGGALIWTLLEAGNLAPIGLGRHRPATVVLWGVGIAIGVIAFGQVVMPVIMKVLGVQIDLRGYGALAGNADAALKLLTYALTSAAFGEEILFRGFLLHQLTAIFGLSARARSLTTLSSGCVFGMAHFIQGPVGIISTGLVGMIMAWMWFRSGRNLWALILAHASIDSFGIAMLYLGWSAF